MFGIDWPVWVVIGLVAGWKTVKHFKPNWAKRVREIEKIAWLIADSAMVLATMANLGEVKAKLMYLERCKQQLKVRGIPVSTREIDHLERVWSQKLREDSAADLVRELTAKLDKMDRKSGSGGVG